MAKRKLCGRPTYDGTPCRNPAGCSVNHGPQHASVGAADGQAAKESCRQALAGSLQAEREESPTDGLPESRNLVLIRDIAISPTDFDEQHSNELIDRFTEECILNDRTLLNECVFGSKGLGGPTTHRMLHGQSDRRTRKAIARRGERFWREGETARQVQLDGGADNPERELRECFEAAQSLELSGEPYGGVDIRDLVIRRRRKLLGTRNTKRPSGPAVDACAYGQYARERAFEMYGDNSGTASGAAYLVSSRCRETYFNEGMTTPRLPAKPEPAAAAEAN